MPKRVGAKRPGANKSSRTAKTPHDAAATPPNLSRVRAPPASVAWLDDPQRQRIEELNRQLLLGMQRHAESAHRAGSKRQILVLEQLRELDVAARVRLAKVPFVLLDADFADGARWKTERLGQSASSAADSSWVDGYDLHILARSLFTFAWHFTQHHAEASRIVFGMAEQTSGVFASLSLRDLERIILQRGHWVRPRWESEPDRWSKLLSRARREGSNQLDQRALQLLYGDLFGDSLWR